MWVWLTRPFCPGHGRAVRRSDEDAPPPRASRWPRRPPDDHPAAPPRRPRVLAPSRIGRHTCVRHRHAARRAATDGQHVGVAGGDLGGEGLGAGTLDDAGHHLALVRQREHDDRALLTGARGAAGAVQVVLVVGRRVDLQDHADVVDVDAAGGDVGGDEHVHRAVAEGAEHAVAHVLRQATVQRRPRGHRARAARRRCGRSRAGCGRRRWCGRRGRRARPSWPSCPAGR